MEDLWLEVIAFNVALDGTKVCESPSLGVYRLWPRGLDGATLRRSVTVCFIGK